MQTRWTQWQTEFFPDDSRSDKFLWMGARTHRWRHVSYESVQDSQRSHEADQYLLRSNPGVLHHSDAPQLSQSRICRRADQFWVSLNQAIKIWSCSQLTFQTGNKSQQNRTGFSTGTWVSLNQKPKSLWLHCVSCWRFSSDSIQHCSATVTAPAATKPTSQFAVRLGKLISIPVSLDVPSYPLPPCQ